LLGVVQDAAAMPSERRKAASELAEHFLPKISGKFPPDECGFAIDPDLARELRDSELKLACLPLAEKLTPYAIAQKATKLQARIREIKQSLRCPCPSLYRADKEVKQDQARLANFRFRRASRIVLTLDEDTEEALRGARYCSFLEGPEMAARQRLADLRQKKRAPDNKGPRLTRAQAATFRLLAVLYPPESGPGPDDETIAEHRFWSLPICDDAPVPDDGIDDDLGTHATTREEAIVHAQNLKQAMPGREWSGLFIPIMDAQGHKIDELAVAVV